jgi:hypothetical protein
MSDPLPLAAAAERLRGRPGRPRRNGDSAVTGPSQRSAPQGPERGALAYSAMAPLHPAVLDVPAAARFLSVSPRQIRLWLASGVLPRVRLPGDTPGAELRKVLIAVADLMRLVEVGREGSR